MGKKLNELWPLDRRGTHTLLAISAVVVGFTFVVSLKAIFTPFFIALLFSYILNPLVNAGEKVRIPRWMTTFLIFVVSLLMMAFLVLVILPSFAQEFRRLTGDGELVKELPHRISVDMKAFLNEKLPSNLLGILREILADWQRGMESSSDWLRENLLSSAKGLLVQVGVWSVLLFDLILIPFYMFFLLTSLNRMWSSLEERLIPYDYREQFLRILKKVHRSLSAFFRGRLLICLMIGTMAWVGLLFLGVPFAFFFGFAIGFSTIVPLLGLVFLLPAMFFYGLAGAGWEQHLILIVFYMVLQGLEMLILTPFILGKEVELHPMVLVLSILTSGYLFGGIGVVLAVPIASTAKILLEEFIFPSFVELSRKGPNSSGVIKKKNDSSETS